MFSGHEGLGAAFSADRLVRAQPKVVYWSRDESARLRVAVYATHFILSFLRFFAQSTR